MSLSPPQSPSPGRRMARLAGQACALGWLRIGPRWRGALAAAALALAGAWSTGPAQAGALASSPHPELAPVAEPPAAGEADAEPVPRRDELDLLLDLQAESIDLGATPGDASASAPQTVSTVDLSSLTPGLPANPLFPGYGLSFELPVGPQRAPLDEDDTDPVPGRSGEAQRLARGAAAALGLDIDSPEGTERVNQVRRWVAQHRTGLFLGLGVCALSLAAITAVLRRAAEAGRVQRRRRRRHGSSGGGSSGSGRSSSRSGGHSVQDSMQALGPDSGLPSRSGRHSSGFGQRSGPSSGHGATDPARSSRRRRKSSRDGARDGSSKARDAV